MALDSVDAGIDCVLDHIICSFRCVPEKHVVSIAYVPNGWRTLEYRFGFKDPWAMVAGFSSR